MNAKDHSALLESHSDDPSLRLEAKLPSNQVDLNHRRLGTKEPCVLPIPHRGVPSAAG